MAQQKRKVTNAIQYMSCMTYIRWTIYSILSVSLFSSFSASTSISLTLLLRGGTAFNDKALELITFQVRIYRSVLYLSFLRIFISFHLLVITDLMFF